MLKCCVWECSRNPWANENFGSSRISKSLSPASPRGFVGENRPTHNFADFDHKMEDMLKSLESEIKQIERKDEQDLNDEIRRQQKQSKSEGQPGQTRLRRTDNSANNSHGVLLLLCWETDAQTDAALDKYR